MKTTCTTSSHRNLGGLSLPSLLSRVFSAHAQTRPPQAQAWIDVATYSGVGMPAGGMGAMAGAALASPPAAQAKVRHQPCQQAKPLRR